MPPWTDLLNSLMGNKNKPHHEKKSSAALPLTAVHQLGEAQWTPRNYNSFATEGYGQNAIVYRCVRMIAEAAASIPLCIIEEGQELIDHPLQQLLDKPNSRQCRPELFEEWYGFLLVAGNSYMEAVSINGEPRELYVLRPDRMKVVPGNDGWPQAYEYRVADRMVRFSIDDETHISPIHHHSFFHPNNDHYGMSPLEAAATAIDIHNAASKWNKALLDNSARPSGALIYTAKEGHLSDEQFERLREELETSFEGPANAGKPLLLEGGLDWKNMGLSPRDMDFIEAKYVAAREIALALGVPPMLLGIPGDNTYSNYAEANRSFWRQTILPLVEKGAKALTNWLMPAYGEQLIISPKFEQVVALSSERETLWERVRAADFLTVNEKRALIGYPSLDEGDKQSSTQNKSS